MEYTPDIFCSCVVIRHSVVTAAIVLLCAEVREVEGQDFVINLQNICLLHYYKRFDFCLVARRLL